MRSVSCSSCEVLIVSISNMLLCIGVNVPLSKAHIYNMANMRLGSKTHKEVVWFDVAMDKLFLVHVLEPLNKLVCKHKGSLKREPVPTELVKVSKAGTEELHRHEVRLVLLSVAIDFGEALTLLCIVNLLL